MYYKTDEKQWQIIVCDKKTSFDINHMTKKLNWNKLIALNYRVKVSICIFAYEYLKK